MVSHDEKSNGSGFTKQEKRSDPDPDPDPDPRPPDDQQQQPHFFPTSKSLKTDYFDQHNKTTMSMRSDSLLSVSAPDANNMLSFSSSSSSSSNTSTNNTTKDGNHTSLFSFYQPSPAYIRNTGILLTFQFHNFCGFCFTLFLCVMLEICSSIFLGRIGDWVFRKLYFC